MLRDLQLYELFTTIKWKFMSNLDALNRKLKEGGDYGETSTYLKLE